MDLVLSQDFYIDRVSVCNDGQTVKLVVLHSINLGYSRVCKSKQVSVIEGFAAQFAELNPLVKNCFYGQVSNYRYGFRFFLKVGEVLAGQLADSVNLSAAVRYWFAMLKLEDPDLEMLFVKAMDRLREEIYLEAKPPRKMSRFLEEALGSNPGVA